MPLQDLTPQLRTRLSRMERGVGWFVFLATLLLLLGFGYYLYNLASQRGWFVTKANFHIYIATSTGLNVGDPVTIMGFSVGRITKIVPWKPGTRHNVQVNFQIFDPYFRYIWSEGSVVKVNPAGFLNQRQIEVTRGTNGYAICVTQPITVFTNLDELKSEVDSEPGQWQLAQEIFDAHSNLLFHAYTWLTDSNLERIAALDLPSVTAYNNRQRDKNYVVAWWHPREHAYMEFTTNEETAWLPVDETPPVADRLQAMIGEVQNALPNFLALTNQITKILNNSAQVTSNLNQTVAQTHPLLNNANLFVARLDTNLNISISQTHPLLTNANTLVANANTLVGNLDTNVTATLINLATITSNLNVQVEANSNMLGSMAKTIHDYDTFVQGLKRFWLLRHLYKNENKTNSAAKNPPAQPVLSPKERTSP
ncbi:MAG TPA: MlaD family protein [Candidatus Sulfotelmatobacter sp.]|nr:MlaD family protein [Candidatus Sulfotelmatobacter sp.]